MKEHIDMRLYKIMISLLLFGAGLLAQNHGLISFGLLVTSYLIVGYDVLLNAVKNIFHGEIFDEAFLMTIATIGAFAIKEYPEAVAVMLFFQIGEYLQDRAVESSKKRVTALAGMKSDVATIEKENKEQIVPIKDVKIGDILLVKPGEKIPLDGDVMVGSSTIDTKAITGESIPREVQVDAHVLSGCVNLTGVLKIKVTNDVTTSTVTKILDLMENANRKKTTTENFITKFARLYTPMIVILALMICLVPVFTGGSFYTWIYRALVFLTISCPCALVISIPLGFISGLGVLSKHGILLKGTNHMETLEKIKIVVLDKTGTLTEGIFKVQEVKPANGIQKEQVLEYAFYAEQYSNHPIAYALKEAYDQKKQAVSLKQYKEIAGKGISASYKNKILLVGNESFMKENKIAFKKEKALGSVVYVAYGNQYMGAIIVADNIRRDAKEMIQRLKEIGISRIVLLSGDHMDNVKMIAQELGIGEYYANLLPQEKVEKLEEIKKSAKGKVMFIGDGMNDAPVLIHSDLGVSMGGIGSDAAIETSNMILMSDHLTNVPTGIRIARKTKQVVWQNIIFALLVKMVVLLLGAFGIANIWHAVFADVGVTLLAILYSFTIYFYHYDKNIK